MTETSTREERAIRLLGQIAGQLDEFEDHAAQLFGGDSPQRLWAWGLRSAIDEALRPSVEPGELHVDAERRRIVPATGIQVRARVGQQWYNTDIAHLDRLSLLTWLRSRGGQNHWAEQTVLALLGHEPPGE